MKIIREQTDWDKSPYDVHNSDYLIGDDGRLLAFRRVGEEKWQKFSRSLYFNRGRRRFKTLKEEIPTNFIEPNQKDPWEKISYNSLEMFFE